jgi:hypothetical protein
MKQQSKNLYIFAMEEDRLPKKKKKKKIYICNRIIPLMQLLKWVEKLTWAWNKLYKKKNGPSV